MEENVLVMIRTLNTAYKAFNLIVPNKYKRAIKKECKVLKVQYVESDCHKWIRIIKRV